MSAGHQSAFATTMLSDSGMAVLIIALILIFHPGSHVANYQDYI